MALKKNEPNKFREFSAQVGGSWRRMSGITCHICNSEGRINIKTAHSLLPPVAIEKKFTEMGWYVGPNENRHVCPQCISTNAKRPTLLLVDNSENVKSMKNVPTLVMTEKTSTSVDAMRAVSPRVETIVKSDQVRVMQRDDRRIIFQKLQDVYIDEKSGYDSGWSDHKVATDLGVPRAWVAQVRDENFGPIGGNPEIEEFMALAAEVETLRKEVTMLSAMRGQMISIDATFKKIDLARLMDRLNHIEKLGEEVKKHIP